MTDDPTSCRIAFLVANDGVEQVELTTPWDAVMAEGWQPVLLAPQYGEVRGRHHLDPGDTFVADTTVADSAPDEFAALVLPGGVANPDDLRVRPDVTRFVHELIEAGTPVAAICHAPWTLIDAGAVFGRRLTSWPSLRTDITNAGGTWLDEEVVVCTNGPNVLITSRRPDDLPAFCRQLVATVGQRTSTASA